MASDLSKEDKEKVLAKYQELRSQEQSLLQKLSEMQAQESEHRYAL